MTLLQAIRHFGNRANLAYALRIKPSAVYQWVRIPDIRQLELEVLTDGALRADRSVRSRYVLDEPVAETKEEVPCE